MKTPEQFVKTMSLVVVSFGIMVSYQNCGSDNVKFSTIDTILSSGKPDFTVNYTRELDVGNVGHFIVSSEDGQIESAEWIFDDGETMNAPEGVRPFNSVGLVKFDVRVKFADANDWITKHDLQVNVIDPSGSCLDLANIRMQSDQIDFNVANPTWQLSVNPLRVGLNFVGDCLAVHLYQVHWTIHTPTVPKGTIIHEQDGHFADIPFNQAGTYHILAEVKYGDEPAVYVEEILTVVDNADPYACKPEMGISGDKNLSNLIVGDTVTFHSSIFECLGHTGEITWYIDGEYVGDTRSITHTFNTIGSNINIRADARKKDGTMDQFYLTANVRENGYGWSCANCGNLVCRDAAGKEAASFHCGKMPIDYACPDVCNPDPEGELD
jgi:hypothetical protein